MVSAEPVAYLPGAAAVRLLHTDKDSAAGLL